MSKVPENLAQNNPVIRLFWVCLIALTLILLTWRIWWAPNNASSWQMGFNSAFKGLKYPLTLTLLTWRIWWAANNPSRWQMGFNSAFKGLKCPLTLILLTWRIWWAANNASKWQMGFNSAFKGLKCPLTLILLTWRIWWAANNASRRQKEFNLVFEGSSYNVARQWLLDSVDIFGTQNETFSPWCNKHWLRLTRKQRVVAKLLIFCGDAKTHKPMSGYPVGRTK